MTHVAIPLPDGKGLVAIAPEDDLYFSLTVMDDQDNTVRVLLHPAVIDALETVLGAAMDAIKDTMRVTREKQAPPTVPGSPALN